MQPLTLLSVVAVYREEHTARAFLACVQQLRTPGLHTVPTRHLQHQTRTAETQVSCSIDVI
jgi:hypothetical protein